MMKNSVATNEYLIELLKTLDPATDATELIYNVIVKCGYFQHPSTRYEKRSCFASIANALFILKGKRYALKHAKLIDEASGSYFGKKAKANVADLARTFIDPQPKQRIIHTLKSQETELRLFSARFTSSQTHISVETAYSLYEAEAKQPMTRYRFTALLKRLGFIVEVKRVNGKNVRCFLNVEYSSTALIFSPVTKLLFICEYVTLFLHRKTNLLILLLAKNSTEKNFIGIVSIVFLFSRERAPPSWIIIAFVFLAS
jgi:hypothetical protein